MVLLLSITRFYLVSLLILITSVFAAFIKWLLLIWFILVLYIQDFIIHSEPIISCACALNELKNKGTIITPEEELGAKIAILLHDVGHGPYSHALENELIHGIDHEAISLLIMQI